MSILKEMVGLLSITDKDLKLQDNQILDNNLVSLSLEQALIKTENITE